MIKERHHTIHTLCINYKQKKNTISCTELSSEFKGYNIGNCVLENIINIDGKLKGKTFIVTYLYITNLLLFLNFQIKIHLNL